MEETQGSGGTVPTEFEAFFAGVFASEIVLDNTTLAHVYEPFRRAIRDRLRKKAEHDWDIERFENRSDPEADIALWLEGEDPHLGELHFVDEGSRTRKDVSLIRVDVAGSFPLEGLGDHDLLADTPAMTGVRLSFHEYAVGVVSGTVAFRLARQPREGEIRKFRMDVHQAIADCAELNMAVVDCDAAFAEAVWHYLEDPKLVDRLVSYERLVEPGDRCHVLYGNLAWTFDTGGKTMDEYPPWSRQFFSVSHPDGPIDMLDYRPGYCHIGWGHSVLVGLHDEDLLRIRTLLRRLERDWRIAHVFNRFLARQLDIDAEFPWRVEPSRLREPMKLIERLAMEAELYEAHHAEALHVMDPASYSVYTRSMDAWRMHDQRRDYHQKLDGLVRLHERAVERLSKRSDLHLNLVLAVIAVFAVTGTVMEFIGYLGLEMTKTVRIAVVCSVAAFAGFVGLYFLKRFVDTHER
ncbi:MAG: hypothetical protein ACYTGZ_13150 [Planctomycetota bacterium]|jgi:hypothetical protein